ncbi:hypothetical protein K439DRAFT_845938 [Ramaria rubella]|nr:hypothetical protein K439DRAFT_845938 [Ramaria rubella]
MSPSLNYTLSILALLSTPLFYYEILNSTDRACHIAKQVFDDAITELGSLLLAPLQVLHLPPHLCRPCHLPHRARLHCAFCCHHSMTLTTTVSTTRCVVHPSCYPPPMTARQRSPRPMSWPPWRRCPAHPTSPRQEHPHQHEWALTVPQGVALAPTQAYSHWVGALTTMSTLSE